MAPPELMVTAPVARKMTIPPLLPPQAFAVSVPPLLMVSVVHWGTRWTTTLWLAKLLPS